MQYPVKRLLRSRKTKKGIQFLVEWDGVDLHGEPWPASWEFRRNINKAALDEYFLKKKRKKTIPKPRKIPTRAAVPFNDLNFQKLIGFNKLNNRLQFTVQATVRIFLHELPEKLRKEYSEKKVALRSKHCDTSHWPRVGSNYQAEIPVCKK